MGEERGNRGRKGEAQTKAVREKVGVVNRTEEDRLGGSVREEGKRGRAALTLMTTGNRRVESAKADDRIETGLKRKPYKQG